MEERGIHLSIVEGLKVGEKAPDFALPSSTGEEIKLSEALQKGPVVLAFYHLAFTGG